MLEKALSSIKETLAIDGYELSYEQPQEGGTIEIFIKAGPNACAECLVPKPILEKTISSVLAENSVSYEKINIHIP